MTVLVYNTVEVEYMTQTQTFEIGDRVYTIASHGAVEAGTVTDVRSRYGGAPVVIVALDHMATRFDYDGTAFKPSDLYRHEHQAQKKLLARTLATIKRRDNKIQQLTFERDYLTMRARRLQKALREKAMK